MQLVLQIIMHLELVNTSESLSEGSINSVTGETESQKDLSQNITIELVGIKGVTCKFSNLEELLALLATGSDSVPSPEHQGMHSSRRE